MHEGVSVAETLGLPIQNVAYSIAGIDETGHWVPPHTLPEFAEGGGWISPQKQ